jgi:site-specific recombinase XerD
MHTAARATDSASLTRLLPSWRLALEGAGKSPKTITSYLSSVVKLASYLRTSGLPDDTEQTGAAEIRSFLAVEIERTSAVSASVQYRNLRVYFGWLAREGERQADNPMLLVDKPKAPARAKPFLSDDNLKALLKACEGNTIEARRDTAIVRTLIDTGVRVSGLANIRYDPADDRRNDVYLSARRLRVRLKGGAEHWIPIGAKTASAIDRYIRARARTPHAGSPWLWIGTRGRGVEHMTDSGIRSMLKRRARKAGVQSVNPHRFRHTFADNWLAAGGSVDDLMNIAGWTTYDMPRLYAKGRGIERAREAHERLSPGDRL